MAGHIKVDRKILQWEWYTDIKMFHLFLYLLLKANWKDGQWQGNLIKRGQVIIGRLKVSKDTGLSEMQIRNCLNKLKSTNEITIKSTNKFTIVTICKYDVYQTQTEESNQQDNQQPNQPITNKQPTSNQQVTTIEEVLIRNKNLKNKENIIGQAEEDFDYKKLLNPKSFPTWREEVKNFLEDEYFIQQQAKDKKIKYGEIVAFMKTFVYDKNLEGDFKNVPALKKHFGYWYKKHIGGTNGHSNSGAMSNGFIEVPMDFDYDGENVVKW